MNWHVARSKTWALFSVGGEGEVEALQRLGGVEGRPAQTQPELALGAARHLVLDQQGEELDVRGLRRDALAIADVEGLEDAGQAQRAQHGGELMGQFPTDLPSSAMGSGKKSVQGRA